MLFCVFKKACICSELLCQMAALGHFVLACTQFMDIAVTASNGCEWDKMPCFIIVHVQMLFNLTPSSGYVKAAKKHVLPFMELKWARLTNKHVRNHNLVSVLLQANSRPYPLLS